MCPSLLDLALASFDELGHNSRATACTVLNLHPSKNLLHAKLAPDLVQRVTISRQSTICLVSNREAVQVFFQDVRLVAHSFGLRLFSFDPQFRSNNFPGGLGCDLLFEFELERKMHLEVHLAVVELDGPSGGVW